MTCQARQLFDCFQLLGIPPKQQDGAVSFSALRIAEREQHRVARDANSFPAILIATHPSNALIGSPPVALEHLRIDFDVLCKIQDGSAGGEIEESFFSVVQCCSHDPEMQRMFFGVAEALIRLIGTYPVPIVVTEATQKLVDLFRSLSLPPQKDIQGLWAELFLIGNAQSPSVLFQAWRAQPEERFDFGLADQRLDVKCTSGESRIHHFSLPQLLPVDGRKVVIASILVERSSSGVTVRQLVDRIGSKLQDPSAIVRLESIVAKSLGDSWADAAEIAYDEALAASKLRFFQQEAIPTVTLPVPIEITDVRFRVDLSGVPTIQRSSQEQMGELLGGALPSRAHQSA